MNIKNQKGLVTFTTFLIWMVAAGAIGAALGVNDFRHKKAVSMCVENGETNCVDKVNAMTKDQILDYIKDR